MIVCNTPILAEPQEILELLHDKTGLIGNIKPTHNNVQFNCPHHGDGHEKKASCGMLTVELKKGNRVYPIGTVHCFSCGYTASIELFVSDIFQYNDGGLYGYKWLIQNYVSVSYENRKPLGIEFERHLDIIKPITFISDKELSKNRFTHPYMYKRKLTDRSINYFDIGFEKETNCITFPVKDLDGNVVFFYRRSVNSKFFNNDIDTPRGEYLYGLYEAYKNVNTAKYLELWICESPIDAITAWQNNRVCVAAFTTNVTEIQINLIKQFPFRKLVVATDNDIAGNIAYKKIYSQLKDSKIIKRFQFPDNRKDLNELTNNEWSVINQ